MKYKCTDCGHPLEDDDGIVNKEKNTLSINCPKCDSILVIQLPIRKPFSQWSKS